MEYDLVVRNGLVIDGSGSPATHADVAVNGDRIVAIGKVDGAGRQDIDADGLVVAPGFVDAHTHMDAQMWWDELGQSSCWQGVTTVVMGNCGYSLAPARPDDRGLVSRNIERAEDIPASAMEQGVPWAWNTFASYLDAVEAKPKGLNYAHAIGHSALRIWAMGERAFEDAATEEDLALMERELSAALAAGAIGLSTSRNTGHTTSDDRPVASRLASWDEVERLVKLVARESEASFQIGGGESDLTHLDHMRRLRDLTVSTGVPILNNVNGLAAAAIIEEALDQGGQIWAMTHSRGFSVLQSFRTKLSFDTLPAWSEIRRRPLDEQRVLLADPDVRRRLVDAAHHGEYKPVAASDPFEPDFDKIFIMYSPYLDNPSVAAEARRRGVDPVEVMIDAGLDSNFDIFFVQSFWDYASRANLANQDVAEFATILRKPYAAMTFSDSGAHASQIADSSIQSHLLAYWVRERQVFTLEEAVRMITMMPAKAWRLRDRGLLRRGYAADLTIFDADTVAPLHPTVVHDIPGGAPRLQQRAAGYAATVVNGQVLTRDGQPTEVRPGRLLRAGQLQDVD